MHEDFDTEGFIPSSVGAAFPTFLNMGGYPADRGKAGLLQLRREALPSAKVTKSQAQMGVVELCNIVTPLLDRSRRYLCEWRPNIPPLH